MALIQQLGINNTALIQFLIFAFAFFFLSQYVFAPYTKALAERESRTTGGEETATETLAKSADLRTQYEAKTRALSGEIKEIFDKYHEQAMKEYHKIISKAREESLALVEANRQKVSTQILEESVKLREEIPTIAASISQKLINR
jgi:F0F1-type ATP synthase membrane subunit b/b'